MYRLTKFGTVTLPTAGIEGDMPTGPTLDPVLQTVNGIFDSRGSEQAPPQFPYPIEHTALVAGTAAAHVRTQLDALRALRGQKQRLYRQDAAGDEHWAWARTQRLNAPIETRYGPSLQPVTVEFVVSDGWYEYVSDGAWFLDAGEVLDDGLYLDAGAGTAFLITASPGTVSVVNGGNRTTYNSILRFTPSGTAIDNMTIESSGISLSFAGTVATTKVLEIDSGQHTVRNAGADAYANFGIETAHIVDGWLPLTPGTTQLVITYNGAGGTVTLDVEQYNGWE